MKQACLIRTRRRFRLPGSAIFALLLLASIIALQAADRVALVLGNSRYDNLSDRFQLKSPVNDATDVAAQLKALGYTVINGGAVTNATRQEMISATEAFVAKAKGAEAAVFYYSGHGIQIGNENFLMTRDTPALTGMASLQDNNVKLQEAVMGALEEVGAKTKIIILDCCRDNPFADQLDRALGQLGKSLQTKSFGEISGYGRGFYLAFATSPGFKALDGNGARNSPFTAAMLKTLPGSASEEIDAFFREVDGLLPDEQVAWTNHSLRVKFFSLASLTKPPIEPSKPVLPSVTASAPAPVKLAPVYRGTLREKGDSSSGKVPLVIRLEAGLKSGTMRQSSRHGDTIVRFNGVWDGAILRAVSSEVVSKPPNVKWDPESFSLRFSDDGKTAHYESEADQRAYVAELTAQSAISAPPAQVYKGVIHPENDTSGPGVPLTIKFEADGESGTVTESSKRGDTVVRFSGVWEAATLRAVTRKVVSIPENVRWTPETFSLSFSEDAATAAYVCRAEGRTYTATLVAP